MFVGDCSHAATLERHILPYDLAKQLDMHLTCVQARNIYERIRWNRAIAHIRDFAPQFDVYVEKRFQAIDREVRRDDEKTTIL